MKQNIQQEVIDSMSSFLKELQPNVRIASSEMTFVKFAEILQSVADELDSAGHAELATHADQILSSVVNDALK